jgi:hypothetical protein
MLIACLRTDGVCSSVIDLACKLRGSIDIPINEALTLEQQLSTETIRVQTDAFDITIERDGIHYTVHDVVVTQNHRYCIYISDRGRQLMKEMETSTANYEEQLVCGWLQMESLW